MQAGNEATTVAPHAVADATALGEQDVVLVTLKTTSFPGVAAALAPLIGPDWRARHGQGNSGRTPRVDAKRACWLYVVY